MISNPQTFDISLFVKIFAISPLLTSYCHHGPPAINSPIISLTTMGSQNASTTSLPQPGSFEIGPRYTFLSRVGNGGYGIVLEARDERTKQNVAIKQMTSLQRPLLLNRAIREIRVLSLLNHDGVTAIYDIFCSTRHLTANKPPELQAIYIVQSLMPTDLGKLLKHDHQQLKSQHNRWIIYQILRAMKYIHSANVIHRDLKPSNILIDQNCHIKICDFGLARVADCDEDGNNLTGPFSEYVQTRWYRAPELLFWSTHYDKSVDVWGIGCILAELLSGKVLFPGRCCIDQIRVILSIMGFPSEDEAKYFVDKGAKIQIGGVSVNRVKPWSELFLNAEPDALDMLDRLLTFGPHKRITVDEALNHSYVASYRDSSNEPLCDRPLDYEMDFRGWSSESLQMLIMDLAEKLRNGMAESNSDSARHC